MSKAKASMELQETMVVGLDELQYQKGVWSKPSRIWEQRQTWAECAASAKEVKTTVRWSPITA